MEQHPWGPSEFLPSHNRELKLFSGARCMAGRRPTPTALNLVTGNPGKRATNKKEPKPRREIPSRPAHLTDEGKVAWGMLVVLLDRTGVRRPASSRPTAGRQPASARSQPGGSPPFVPALVHRHFLLIAAECVIDGAAALHARRFLRSDLGLAPRRPGAGLALCREGPRLAHALRSDLNSPPGFLLCYRRHRRTTVQLYA